MLSSMFNSTTRQEVFANEDLCGLLKKGGLKLVDRGADTIALLDRCGKELERFNLQLSSVNDIYIFACDYMAEKD